MLKNKTDKMKRILFRNGKEIKCTAFHLEVIVKRLKEMSGTPRTKNNWFTFSTDETPDFLIDINQIVCIR